MRPTAIIAELTFREAWRRRIVWLALVLGVLFVALYTVGFYFIYRDTMAAGPEGASRAAIDSGVSMVTMAGLYAISFLGVMLAVLMSVGTLSGEIQSHTIQSVATKPIRRSSIVLGKWLGLAAMLVVYEALLSFGVILGTYFVSGSMLINAVEGVALMAFQSLIMLSLCLAGGTHLSTVANGVFAFMMYGLAFVGGWIEQIGSAIHNETAVDIGIWSSLIVPSEAVWKRAAYRMQPPAVNALNLSPFSMASAPSVAMLVYAGLYCLLCLYLAVRWFSRRDL
jgi:ABC-type transport system involved in multi-copper enzyme maturation permease subunit